MRPRLRVPLAPALASLLALACGDDGTATAATTEADTASTGPAATAADPSTSAPTTGDDSTGPSTITTGPVADDATTGTSTGGSETTDATTGGANDECDVPELLHAPPVTEADGLTVVPLDILDDRATVTIDAASEQAAVVAVMHFRLGPHGGHPAFDLRQQILAADLDGAPVDPALLAAHDLGGGPDADMRVIAVDLPPCSEHTLTLTYDLHTPDAPAAKGLEWQQTRVKWDAWNSDLYPGRYLEAWFPANLIYDRFPFTLDVQLVNSAHDHLLATNGALEAPEAGRWVVTWPDTATALSMMFVLVAADRVETTSAVVDLADDTQLTLELWRDIDLPLQLSDFKNDMVGHLDEFVTSVGPYGHGDRFVAYAWTDPNRSMEYDGATTTAPEYADHETFHSWWGRSIKPASQNDGWIDEAWDMHAVTIGFNETPIDFLDDPVALAPASPWSRVTPNDSYTVGERVFAGIAAMVGTPALQLAMHNYYLDHHGEFITTAQLENYLFCTLDEPGVRAIFHRFVYGADGDPPPPPADYCN